MCSEEFDLLVEVDKVDRAKERVAEAVALRDSGQLVTADEFDAYLKAVDL